MSTRRPAPDNLQPEKFAFTKKNAKAINNILLKYPEGRKASALLPLLDLAQRQHDNWLPKAAMSEVAKILSLPMIKVLEVATFYTMYNLYPVGKNLLQICTTTPCWLRGSEDIVSICKDKLGTTLTIQSLTSVDLNRNHYYATTVEIRQNATLGVCQKSAH